MRLVFHISTISGGGAGRVVSNLANAFSKAGHTVYVITVIRYENEYPLEKNVRRYVLENKSCNSFVVRNVKRVIKLRKILKIIKPDLLISFLGEPNIRAMIASRFMGIKTIVSIRNDPSKEYPTKFSSFLARTLFRRADGIVFQTHDARDWFPQRIQERSAIILNFVNEVFFKTERMLDVHDIVAIGRLAPQKNHRCLIEAYSQIADQVKDDLLIYGDEYKNEHIRKELENIIKRKGLEKRIHLPGSTEVVHEVLASAKLYVLSSDYEGMPNSLMEAMTVGVPCISTDCPCGGPRMLIDNEVNGILVAVGDSQVMADAMLRVLNDDAIRRLLGENAKRSSLAFSREKVFAQWNTFFEHVLGQNQERV